MLQFSGWSYRQAYSERFGIDPASIEGAGSRIAIDGVGAITVAMGVAVLALLPLMASLALVFYAGRWLHKRGWFRRGEPSLDPFSDRASVFIGISAALALTVMIISASGAVLGRWVANARISNVKHDKVWTYHVGNAAMSGVVIAQSRDITWLLTAKAVRGFKPGTSI